MSDEKRPAPLTAAELARGDFPRLKNLWGNFILKDSPNLIYGDGGAGKTLLDLHIAVSVASGKPVLGIEPDGSKPRPVFILLAEDDNGETKARLEAICKMTSLSLADLPITVWGLPGWDAVLVEIDDSGREKPQPFYRELEPHLAKLSEGNGLLILDTVADVAILNENIRQPVNTFAKRFLGMLCRKHGITIILNAHPSKSSMESGYNYAGSTAWNNGFRSRNILQHVKDTPKDHRQLSVMKANYRREETLNLVFSDDGLTFKVPSPRDKHEKQTSEMEAVLKCVSDLLGCRVKVTPSGREGAHGPKEIAERIGSGLTKNDVGGHLKRLVVDGKLGLDPGNGHKPGRGYFLPEAMQAVAA